MSDFYNGGNGGGGGGGSIDPDSIPDEQNIFLGASSKFTAGVPDKGWLQSPMAMFKVAGGSNRIWLAAFRKEYALNNPDKKPPFLINDSSQALKSRYLELNFDCYYSSANHVEAKKFLLLDIGLLANSDDGKFVKIKKISGGIWDYELDTPSSTPELFEVYIDRVDSSNNRNVNYNDIVAAFNSGKIVYVKEHTNVNDRDFVYFIETCDTVNGTVDFHCLGYFETRACRITDSNSYSFYDYDLFTETADIDESVTPPNTNNVNFDKLKTVYNKAQQVDIILIYTNSNGNKYKLPAVKLTATEIMFSVYDPDTARNLSVIINDQNQYTVIT